MSWAIVALVLFGALLHASWNALIKSGRDQQLDTALIHVLGCGVGLVMVAAGVQSPTPTFPVLAGGLIVLNAAVVIGPIGAFRLVGRPLHRLLDLAVIAVVVVVAALPFIDIDSASRLTMVVLVGVMAFVWLSTNFDQPPSRADPRGATFSRRGTMVAPAQPRPAGATRDSRRRPMRSRVDAETIGRTAGRLVGRASEYARRRRERR